MSDVRVRTENHESSLVDRLPCFSGSLDGRPRGFLVGGSIPGSTLNLCDPLPQGHRECSSLGEKWSMVLVFS